MEKEEGRELKGVYVLEGRERRERQGRGTRDAAVMGMGKGREGKTHSQIIDEIRLRNGTLPLAYI